ncbi:hypothetical protein D3C81_1769410 [compost metagenome]
MTVANPIIKIIPALIIILPATRVVAVNTTPATKDAAAAIAVLAISIVMFPIKSARV